MASGLEAEAAVAAEGPGCEGGPPPPPPPEPPEPCHGERRPRHQPMGSHPLDDRIKRVLSWLREVPLSEVSPDPGPSADLSGVVASVLSSSKKHTFQQTKTFKHRAQIEAIAAHCLRLLPPACEVVVELGAGQAVLGHAVSAASGLPLVAIERRGNTDAFDTEPAAASTLPPAGDDGDAGADAPSPAERPPAARRVQADIADEGAWPDAGHVAVLGKHLCGHSSDLAVDAALRLGPRLSLLCLAPCCHAKMRWGCLAPEAQRWLEEAGLPCGADGFALLADVVRLSRVGAPGAGAPTPCGKWRLRQHLNGKEAELMGRRACRAVDEARLARLRAAGLRAELVEYCGAGLTPDNVLILASRAPPEDPDAAPAAAFAPVACQAPSAAPNSASAGVLVELDPTGPPTLQQRLTAYLLEQQLGLFPSLRAAVPVTDALASRVPGLVCVTRDGDAKGAQALLAELARCPLLQRCATRLLPFGRCSASVPALAEEVAAELALAGPGASVRVFARPRELEGEVCSALGPRLLSPTGFTHQLCVLPAAADAAGVLRRALVPRAEVDLSEWAAARKAEAGCRAFWRCFEVASRWPHRFSGAEAVALWTDGQDPESWLERWADRFLPPGAPACELRLLGRPRGQDAEAPDGLAVRPLREGSGPAAGASVLLADVSFSGEDAMDALRRLLAACLAGGAVDAARPLAPSGTAVLRLRCGKRPRAVKRWLREAAKSLEARLAASRVELLHLLGDRDAERTAVFRWSGPPPPAAAAGEAAAEAAEGEASEEASGAA
uniref:tRNA:m(4)X modification enzyme TRM13 n=1 Tax=Alexandrium monilatum TaxID=311494 RepID=A0A7S4W775_9DINO